MYPKPEFKKYVLTESGKILSAYYFNDINEPRSVEPHDPNDDGYCCIEEGGKLVYRDLKEGYDIFWDEFSANSIAYCRSRVIVESDDQETLEELRKTLKLEPKTKEMTQEEMDKLSKICDEWLNTGK